MSLLIGKLASKFKIAKTTNDLIYKDKSVDVHKIESSYKKLVKEGTMLELPFKYGKQSLYISKDNETAMNLTTLQVLYAELSDIKFNSTNGTFNSNKILQNEIFNSLWIEGVRSSKRQIKQFLKKPSDNWPDKFAAYSINYYTAYNYVATTKTINEETLFALYIILSKDIDLGDEKLDGYPYRKDSVFVGDQGKQGIEATKIKESLDMIFHLSDLDKERENTGVDFHNKLLGTLVVHYLFELIHPYYDMNGRMGRLFALWYGSNSGIGMYLSSFSESINHFKKESYYEAFKKSDTNGFKYDVTYFVQSILFAMTSHTISDLLIMQINEEIKDKHKIKLSDLQRDILMGIITKEDKWYLAENFILGIEGINQGQLSNDLSNLVKLGILDSTKTKPKEYKFNWETYSSWVDNLINKHIKSVNKKIDQFK